MTNMNLIKLQHIIFLPKQSSTTYLPLQCMKMGWKLNLAPDTILNKYYYKL